MDVEAHYLIGAYQDELAQAQQRIVVLTALVKQLTDARMADQLAQAQADDDKPAAGAGDPPAEG